MEADHDDKRPALRITGLHIRGLKSIKALDLPQDGLGWQDKSRLPDLVVIGGENGSGKTTLLRLLYGVAAWLGGDLKPGVSLLTGQTPPDIAVRAQSLDALQKDYAASLPEVQVDLTLRAGDLPEQELRFLCGSPSFIEQRKTPNSFGLGVGLPSFPLGADHPEFLRLVAFTMAGAQGLVPAVVYLPINRYLALIPSERKQAVELPRFTAFTYEFKEPETWADSIEAWLYAARWADLNAIDAGQPQEAVFFKGYTAAFGHFFGTKKTVSWTTRGKLVIRTEDGKEHGLNALSAGENEVIVLCAELLLRWRPGSLILLDEPELHLHYAWMSKLLELLQRFQKERGGQVILTTQSGEFFDLAPNESCVLLDRRPL